MTPSGLRISWARPAESCPRAARRSERRASASARLAICFFELLRQLLIFLNLLAILGSEAVDDDGGDVEEKNARARDRWRLGGEVVFLEGGDSNAQ